MRNVISGMAYFFATALAIMIVLMIVATLNMQRLGYAEAVTETTAGHALVQASDGEGEGADTAANPQNQIQNHQTENGGGAAPEAGVETASPERNVHVNPNAVYYEGGDFELPVSGATGYTSVDINITWENGTVDTLRAGTAFVIAEELKGNDGEWWIISVRGRRGWIRHVYCMINLPDVIPSIVYINANAYSSAFRADGKDIPNITGMALYSYNAPERRDGRAENKRLGDYEYIVPVLYSTAKKICAAQRYALENGDTIIIYEAFRPYDTQQSVAREVQRLSGADPDVRKALNTSPWSMGWFIASGTSNHQEGYAMDITLGQVINETDKVTGDYKYRRVVSYYPYEMPTEIHDLGRAAAVYTGPNSRTFSASFNANEYAKTLQKYCVDAGLSPLASEWWHFNDEEPRRSLSKRSGGKYEIKDCLSKAPMNYD